jgi:hypothetical protein
MINYYYFGLYLVAYLIKLTGVYAEVAFNLTIATLFALTVINVFAVAYSAMAAERERGRGGDWRVGDWHLEIRLWKSSLPLSPSPPLLFPGAPASARRYSPRST